MNAQIELIEAALTCGPGVAYQGARDPVLRPARGQGGDPSPRRSGLDETGLAMLRAVRRRWADEVGFEGGRGRRSRGRRRKRRQSSLKGALLSIIHIVRARDAVNQCRECHRRAGSPSRARARERRRWRQPPDVPPRERPQWDAVFLPMLEEARCRSVRRSTTTGPSPRNGASYVGITRARIHPRAVVGATSGDPRPRRASRAEPVSARRPWRRSNPRSRGPRYPRVRAPRPGDDGDPVCRASASGRTGVARDEAGMPPVIAHDATLAPLPRARPRRSAL
jgi:hypothetical protein